MERLIYVLGGPGSGKSTVLGLVTARWQGTQLDAPIAHIAFHAPGFSFTPTAIELGRRRVLFSGTDALPMNVIGKAIEFVRSKPCPLVFAEGDRLACRRFLDEASFAYEVIVVHLVTPLDVAAERREHRRGQQDEAWVKGRFTKHAKLAREFDAHVIDGTAEPGVLAAQVADLVGLV